MIDKYLMHMKKELMKVKMDEGNKIKFKKKTYKRHREDLVCSMTNLKAVQEGRIGQ